MCAPYIMCLRVVPLGVPSLNAHCSTVLRKVQSHSVGTHEGAIDPASLDVLCLVHPYERTIGIVRSYGVRVSPDCVAIPQCLKCRRDCTSVLCPPGYRRMPTTSFARAEFPYKGIASVYSRVVPSATLKIWRGGNVPVQGGKRELPTNRTSAHRTKPCMRLASCPTLGQWPRVYWEGFKEPHLLWRISFKAQLCPGLPHKQYYTVV